MVGVAVYVVIDVALVFLRPEFSVLHNAESDYGSAGAYAWLMDLNFLLRCALSLAAVRALALTANTGSLLRTALAFLTTWAIASGLLAFFPDDPVGTTTHGAARVHLVLAFVAFVAVILGTRLATRALRTDAAWRPVIPALMILSWGALVPILLLGRARLRANSYGGLYEKIFLLIELIWLFIAAAWVARLEEASTADPRLVSSESQPLVR
jgi:hypothetical membrane protein